MDAAKRHENEKKFQHWEMLANGGRRYSYEVRGQFGWAARYVKVVDENETTIKFYQEIYNAHGELVEVHKKYPFDKGHQRVKR